MLPILIPQVLLNWPVYTGTKQAKAIKFKTPANEVSKNQCAAVIHVHTAIKDCPSYIIIPYSGKLSREKTFANNLVKIRFSRSE